MAIYSVGRKRVILALLLTSVLLLTLDLRGNPVFDGVRNGFSYAMDPVESAADVVTNPIERIWHGITDYDDLEQENLALQEQVDRLSGTQAAAEAAVIEGKELQALYSLPSLSGIDTEVARVVGYAANNLDQVIEIDKGSLSGIESGCRSSTRPGLVGKVTQVSANSARVMLVDRCPLQHRRQGHLLRAGRWPTRLSDTTPSGLDPQQVADAATTTTTVPVALVPGVTGPDGLPVPASTLPGATQPDPFVDANGRTLDRGRGPGARRGVQHDGSVPEDSLPERLAGHHDRRRVDHHNHDDGADIEKEYGALEGRGRLRLPQIRFLQDTPSLAELQVGDLVETAGGSESLAPPGIPVGRVLNRANRPGSGGPLLEVELNADLGRLNFVRVVLYKPLSEVGQ